MGLSFKTATHSLIAVLLCTLSSGCSESHGKDLKGDRKVVTYWEKWTNFEKDAMLDIVKKYNESQDEVYVEFISTSTIDAKLLLATAGGNPPDIAGFWSHTVYNFADKGALIPLDEFMKKDGLSGSDYLPSVYEACTYKGFTWGLPSTPATVALHYNKDLFREAGLDPDSPPQSIKELDEYAKKLTKVDSDGKYTQLGFLPTDPGWWGTMWVFWFGGSLVNESGTEILIDSEESKTAFNWVQSYLKDYDAQRIKDFEATHRGEFASPSNSFMSGRVAMKLQGVWMSSFIEKFSDNLDWGVAPFPSYHPDPEKPATVVETDILVIPRGAKNVEEAWDFIRFVQRQEIMEELCLKHRKFSPLMEVSDEFYKEHANPYIRVFRELAESPNAQAVPKVPVWEEYRHEIEVAMEEIWLKGSPVEPTLEYIKKRIDPKLDRAILRWEKVKETRLEEWKVK